jgi:chromosome segregation and condensation protein ScpB
LYATTHEFLALFGLRDLSDLPPLKEFEEMAKAQAVAVAEEEGLSVEDLISTPDELVHVEEEDRAALEELDEKLKDLSRVDRSVSET